MRRLAVLVAVAVTLPCAAPTSALACSCVQQTAEESFARATAVFEGRVHSIERLGPANVAPARLRVTLDVVQTWKGAEHEHFVLETSEAESSCGFPFAEGQSYLVYAQGDAAQATTGLCSGTKLVTAAADEIAALGAGVVPVDVTDAPTHAVAPRAHGGRGGCASCDVAATHLQLSLAIPFGVALSIFAWSRARRRLSS